MTTGYKTDNPQGLYYMTFQIVNWLDLFTRQIYRDILIKNLRFCQENKGLRLFSYVIMSNHVHLIASAEEGFDLSKTVGNLKSFCAKEFLTAIQEPGESRRDHLLHTFSQAAALHKRNEKYQVWTHENHAEELSTFDFTRQKLNYIHNNPIRAGLVRRAEDYVYSSAGYYAGDIDALLEVELL